MRRREKNGRRDLRIYLYLGAILFLVWGCEPKGDNGEGPIDAGIDSETWGDGGVGAPCISAESCRPELICKSESPDGYCTKECGREDPDCFEGNYCVALSEGWGTYCFKSCVEPSECRAGYGCEAVPGSSIKICYPAF